MIMTQHFFVLSISQDFLLWSEFCHPFAIVSYVSHLSFFVLIKVFIQIKVVLQVNIEAVAAADAMHLD
jgi:hypothetical protein